MSDRKLRGYLQPGIASERVFVNATVWPGAGARAELAASARAMSGLICTMLSGTEGLGFSPLGSGFPLLFEESCSFNLGIRMLVSWI